MAMFDFWRRWADVLPDGAFARAWFVMGLYEATAVQSGDRHRRALMSLVPTFPAPRRAHVLDMVTRAIAAAARDHVPVAWTFPTIQGSNTPGPALGDVMAPEGWHEVATTVLERFLKTHRVEAVRASYPSQAEPAGPWAAALRAGSGRAVSLNVDAPKAQLHLGWPLRFGTLGGAGSLAARSVESAMGSWPANKLARAVNLGRDEANCDVLVHVGSTTELVAQLMAQPVRLKADLLLIAGDAGAAAEAFDERKRLLLSETAAGGIALVPWIGSSEDLGAALNEFMLHVTHNETFDLALHLAIGATYGPSLVWMSDALARMRVGDVAQRLDARLKSMAPGTRIDRSRMRRPDLVQSAPPVPPPMPLPTPSMGPSAPVPVTPPVAPSRAGSVPPPSLPDDPFAPFATTAARRPEFELRTRDLTFDAESAGATDLVEVTEALDGADEPTDAQVSRAARHLQQRSSVVHADGRDRPANGGFLLGLKAKVSVRIGVPGAGWQSLGEAFPVEKLPPDVERYRLTVWLTEPNQLAAPLRGEIVLPRDGASSECELEFTPLALGRFDGRVSVLHRGRVLQTAALRGRVLAPPANDNPLVGLAAEPDGTPRLEELAGVRHKMGDLDVRRQFDLAFVSNHTATGQPRLTALADRRAWVVDTDGAKSMMEEINAELSKVAHFVADYKEGLDSQNGQRLLVKLAQAGAALRIFLVDEQLERQGAHSAIAKDEYIQIVSVRSDGAIPFEFIYDPEPPADDAAVCPHWRDALEAGSCPGHCPGEPSSRVCPMGFWGLRKVIERHHVTPELAEGGKEVFLQSEPGRRSPTLSVRGPVLLASSHRVPDESLKAVQTKLSGFEGVSVLPAKSWEEWQSAVEQQNPRFILSMPHTDGKGSGVSLEISKKTLKTIRLTAQHVCPTRQSKAPLVALLGCDTATSAETFTFHVAVFRAKGAAVVIATIATVFGEHAASVAELLSEELLRPRPAPFRLGELIRDIKRRSLLDKRLMPLCVVAYGDADWQIAN